MRIFVIIVAACCGGILNYGGSWIVHHDSVNYRLPAIVSGAAETAFALGPVLWAVGLILALPLALGYLRHVRHFSKLVAMYAASYLTLVCGLGSFGSLSLLGFLGATALLWIFGAIWAGVSLPGSAQPDAPGNSRHASQ